MNQDANVRDRVANPWHHGRHVHHGHRPHRHEASWRATTPSDAAGSPTSPDAATTSLTYRRTEKAAIYIRTQEGDTVALKIKSRDAVGADIGTTSNSDTPATELKLAGTSATKVAVFVHGDLNPDELAAIQSVVDQAGALADQFFAGDAQGAFTAAGDLNIDASQLAKVGLRLSVREQATYASLGSVRPAPEASAGATPDTTPTEPTVAATPDTAPTEPTAAAADTAAPEATDAPPSATTADPASDTAPGATAASDSPAPASDASGTDTAASQPETTPPTPVSDPASVLGTIADFLHQLLDALGAPAAAQDQSSSVSLDLSLKIKIFQSIVVTASSSGSDQTAGTTDTTATDAAAEPSTASATGVLSDTLDALAAQQQPPLDTTT